MKLHLCMGLDARSGKSVLAFRVLDNNQPLVGLATALRGDIKDILHDQPEPHEVEYRYAILVGTIKSSEMKTAEVTTDDQHLDEYLQKFGFNEASINQIWDLLIKTETTIRRFEVNLYAEIDGFGAF